MRWTYAYTPGHRTVFLLDLYWKVKIVNVKGNSRSGVENKNQGDIDWHRKKNKVEEARVKKKE